MSRILVADDSETILLLMRRRLEMEGYEVETAGDGEEAMAALEAAAPDLLLLDAMMPRKSGLDVVEELGARGSRIPVLIISAHQEPEEAAAVDGYVRKPIDFDDLLARIRSLTGG